MQPLPPALAVEGHAIVSVDGMIAAADGTMPKALRNDADWRLFQAALDRSGLVVVGRLGHERHPNPGRRRLVVTGSVDALADDPSDPMAVRWNPAGLDLASCLARIGVSAGTIAVTGGTGVFEFFLPHYATFVLSEVHGFALPGGRPAFRASHPRTVLAAAGLAPGSSETLGPGVTLTRWTRSHPASAA